MTAATDSRVVWVGQFGIERGMHLETSVSMVDLSFNRKWCKTYEGLNKVGAKSNATSLAQLNGTNFPHIVVLDFAQDNKLGGVAVGWSRPSANSIHEPLSSVTGLWCMCSNALPNIQKTLEQTCPGLVMY